MRKHLQLQEQKPRKHDKKEENVPLENNSTMLMEVEIGEQEQNIGKIELEQEASKNCKSVQNKRSKNLKHQENFIMKIRMWCQRRGWKIKSNTKRIVVELSDFEKNDTQKNVEERRKLEKELGINTTKSK